jgi:hypothetical protein
MQASKGGFSSERPIPGSIRPETGYVGHGKRVVLPNARFAVDAGIDPRPWARLLRRAYDRAVVGGAPSTIVRGVVADSWARCKLAKVDPVALPPIMLDRAEAGRLFRRHRLAMLLHMVEGVLVEVAAYAHQLVAIADREGLVLWTGGNPETLSAARKIHLEPGVVWSEQMAGTNALGTALVLDHPLQIFAAEHFKPCFHGWSASAAPIHDPETGELLGAVALAGSVKRAHPHGFSLVAAAAQILEAQLDHEATHRDERLKVSYLERIVRGCAEDSAVLNRGGRVLLSTPPGWLGRKLRLARDGTPVAPAAEEVHFEPLADCDGFLALRGPSAANGAGRPTLRLEALGRERARLTIDGRVFDLSPRHSEILVILTDHPDGLTEPELAAALYGTPMKSVTIRAEISRLHKLVGSVIRTRPYRIAADVEADFLEQPPSGGEHGELLPASQAPAVLALRNRLEPATA